MSNTCAKADWPDDPYYYLSVDLVPSYWELETQIDPNGGHVLRFDSFSKILSGGLRLGYVTGPKALIKAINYQTAAISLHASTLSQMVAYKILVHWGTQGFLAQAKETAKFYAERRVWFEAAAQRHLGELVDWVSPSAGLFLWVDLSKAGIKDADALIKSSGIEHGVIACPGTA